MPQLFHLLLALRVVVAFNLYYGLADEKSAALFAAKINLSFTAACESWLEGCSSETHAEQFAPRDSLPSGKG